MTEENELTFGGVWAGLSTILISVLALGVLVFTSGPVNTGGVIAGSVLAVVGLAELFGPRVLRWFSSLSSRWTGLFWILGGVGLVILGVVASTTIGKFGGGLILGAGFMLYGCFIALDC